MIEIDNVYSIGSRCNCDDFLKCYDFRNESSPFSYMLIDLECVVITIETHFEYFLTNIELLQHPTSIDPPNDQSRTRWINASNVYRNTKKHFMWDNHDMGDQNIVNNIRRRSTRFMDRLEHKPRSTLLVCILPVDSDIHYQITVCERITQVFPVNIALINPVTRETPVDIQRKDTIIIYTHTSAGDNDHPLWRYNGKTINQLKHASEQSWNNLAFNFTANYTLKNDS